MTAQVCVAQTDWRILLRIQGSGAVQPALQRLSEELDEQFGKPQGWTKANFSIQRRSVATGEETSSFLGADAAKQALEAAGWAPSDLDVIIGACGVMEQPIPGTAPLVQRRLGLGSSGIPAFDINAICLSFLVALDVVNAGFASGRWRRAIIVSADIASAGLDFRHPEAAAIFGDGAAAIAVEAADGESAMLGYRLETYSEDADLCRLEAGGTRVRPQDGLQEFLDRSKFAMDGPALFMATARRFPAFVSKLLEACGLTAAQINLVVPHQASAQALEHLRRALPAAADRVVDIFSDHGNQMAASMPIALHHAISTSRLKRGNLALLVGSAAGVSLGGAVIRY